MLLIYRWSLIMRQFSDRNLIFGDIFPQTELN